MHPENIRLILGKDANKAKRDYMRTHNCSEHTASQLFGAWASILAAYDAGLLDAWYPGRKAQR